MLRNVWWKRRGSAAPTPGGRAAWSSLLCVALSAMVSYGCSSDEGTSPVPADVICPAATIDQDGECVPNDPLHTSASPATEWQLPFPAMPLPAGGNPTTPDKVELGRMLFFDPLLSGSNDVSCAHCHHPDLGMADDRALSMGIGAVGIGQHREGGAVLSRNAPTVWNSAYSVMQFWDGRVTTLEEQAIGPLESDLEMAAEVAAIPIKLAQVEGYEELFGRAFPEASAPLIDLERMAKAIAAFERTVLSHSSAFDRFAAGQSDALSDSENRGWELFRSDALGCTNCHSVPAFGGSSFAITGVPQMAGLEPDEGRKMITENDADLGAFKVPTLRNITETGPYMHNGAFGSLAEVVDFYAAGAGAGAGSELTRIDPRLAPFDLDEAERTDLVNFLGSLTDVSGAPLTPEQVPSGLPVAGQ